MLQNSNTSASEISDRSIAIRRKLQQALHRPFLSPSLENIAQRPAGSCCMHGRRHIVLHWQFSTHILRFIRCGVLFIVCWICEQSECRCKDRNFNVPAVCSLKEALVAERVADVAVPQRRTPSPASLKGEVLAWTAPERPRGALRRALSPSLWRSFGTGHARAAGSPTIADVKGSPPVCLLGVSAALGSSSSCLWPWNDGS